MFQQNSRGDNYILDIVNSKKNLNVKELASELLGKVVFVSWPHLVEAKVTLATILCIILLLRKYFSLMRVALS